MALQKVNRNLLNTGVSDSSDATAITIDSSENVGIGTTTTDPYSLGATGKTLSINSSNADTGALLGLESADTKRGYLFGNQSNVVLSAVPSIPLVFKTADTTRMTILADGKVGIGTGSPAQALSVYPDDDYTAIIGRAKVGNLGYSDFAGFAHLDSGSQYAILQHHTGETYVNAASGYPINFRVNNANVGRFDTDGLKFGTDAAAANGLNDYEEGTWTPAYYADGSTTYAAQAGTYTKVGDYVTAWFHLDINVNGATGSQGLIISGLPFTAANISENYGSISGVHCNQWSSSKKPDNVLIAPNGSIATLYRSEGQTGIDVPLHSDIGGGNLLGCLFYKAA